MEIKKWIGISIVFMLMACSQRTYTIQKLKGTYREVQTENSKWSDNCILNVGDSTLSLKNYRLLKDFTANKIRVVEDNLLY